MKYFFDIDGLKEILNANGLTYEGLGMGSRATVSKFVNNGAWEWQVRKLHKILDIHPSKFLEKESAVRWELIDCPPETHCVRWEEFKGSAKQTGLKLFGPSFKANTVLTFAGPSMIFAGLAMRLAMSPEEIIRIPVYVGFFSGSENLLSDPMYERVDVQGSTLVLPRALITDRPEVKKRICVLDDAIITGHSMNALRTYFKTANPKPDAVEFGCSICTVDQWRTARLRPKCELRSKFDRIIMPWDMPAFSFEEASKLEVHSDGQGEIA